VREPATVQALVELRPSFRLPYLAMPTLGWPEIVTGVLVLGLLTAAVAMWNMGAGYAVGLAAAYAFERGWLKV
jgi:hypothetical protein